MKLLKPTRRKLILGGASILAMPAILRAQVPMTGAGKGTPTVAAWTPKSLTNLLTWVKGDVGTFSDTGGTTPCNNGDAVKYWQDQSGNGNHLISGATAVATYATNDLNGLATVHPNGTAAQALRAASVAVGTLNTMAAFGVFKNPSAASVSINYLVGSGHTTDYDNATSFYFFYTNTTTSDAYHWNNNLSQSGNTITPANWTQLGIVFNGTTGTTYAGGSAGTPATAAYLTVSPISYGLGMSFESNTYVHPLTGGIAEWFICDSVPSAGDLTNIHTYLLGRWGV